MENFQAMTLDEQMDVDGGSVLIACGIIIIAAAFALGVYNGYKGKD